MKKKYVLLSMGLSVTLAASNLAAASAAGLEDLAARLGFGSETEKEELSETQRKARIQVVSITGNELTYIELDRGNTAEEGTDSVSESAETLEETETASEFTPEDSESAGEGDSDETVNNWQWGAGAIDWDALSEAFNAGESPGENDGNGGEMPGGGDGGNGGGMPERGDMPDIGEMPDGEGENGDSPENGGPGGGFDMSDLAEAFSSGDMEMPADRGEMFGGGEMPERGEMPDGEGENGDSPGNGGPGGGFDMSDLAEAFSNGDMEMPADRREMFGSGEMPEREEMPDGERENEDSQENDGSGGGFNLSDLAEAFSSGDVEMPDIGELFGGGMAEGEEQSGSGGENGESMPEAEEMPDGEEENAAGTSENDGTGGGFNLSDLAEAFSSGDMEMPDIGELFGGGMAEGEEQSGFGGENGESMPEEEEMPDGEEENAADTSENDGSGGGFNLSDLAEAFGGGDVEMPDLGEMFSGGFGRSSSADTSEESAQEPVTVYLQVGVVVHTDSGKERTFSILQAGDELEALFETDENGNEVITEMWLLSSD